MVDSKETKLVALLQTLSKINEELLMILRTPRRDTERLSSLLEERLVNSAALSSQFGSDTSLFGELSTTVKTETEKVLVQDRELMIHLNMEQTKFMGKLHRLRLLNK